MLHKCCIRPPGVMVDSSPVRAQRPLCPPPPPLPSRFRANTPPARHARMPLRDSSRAAFVVSARTQFPRDLRGGVWYHPPRPRGDSPRTPETHRHTVAARTIEPACILQESFLRIREKIRSRHEQKRATRRAFLHVFEQGPSTEPEERHRRKALSFVLAFFPSCGGRRKERNRCAKRIRHNRQPTKGISFPVDCCGISRLPEHCSPSSGTDFGPRILLAFRIGSIAR